MGSVSRQGFGTIAINKPIESEHPNDVSKPSFDGLQCTQFFRTLDRLDEFFFFFKT
jgi:hypothetical protein